LEVNMRTYDYSSLAHSVQQRVIGLLHEELHPDDFSARCSSWVLLGCLVLAAATRASLALVAALRDRCPSRETLRLALYQTLPDYQELLQRLPRLLRASLPRGLRKRRRRYPLAIDLHVVPYYKRQHVPPAHVRKGKRQPGTTYSHQYATASLLRKGQYYLVALTPYVPGENMGSLVRRLLRQAARNGFAPRYVLMDRSFWAFEVVRYLQRARYPFLMPVAARGHKPTAPGGPTGTRKFLHGCPSGRYTYRLGSRSRQQTTLTIVVHRRNHAGRQGKRGRYARAFGMWRMQLSSIAWVQESYRRRFRIESSYRLLEAARGRTSSRQEGWRLWYVVLAALLLNAWLTVRRAETGPRNGGAKERWWWNRLLTALTFRLLKEPAVAYPAAPDAKVRSEMT
jgi:putative transposase